VPDDERPVIRLGQVADASLPLQLSTWKFAFLSIKATLYFIHDYREMEKLANPSPDMTAINLRAIIS